MRKARTSSDACTRGARDERDARRSALCCQQRSPPSLHLRSATTRRTACPRSSTRSTPGTRLLAPLAPALCPLAQRLTWRRLRGGWLGAAAGQAAALVRRLAALFQRWRAPKDIARPAVGCLALGAGRVSWRAWRRLIAPASRSASARRPRRSTAASTAFAGWRAWKRCDGLFDHKRVLRKERVSDRQPHACGVMCWHAGWEAKAHIVAVLCALAAVIR